MKGQTYRMAMLFDFFGDVLTDRQKDYFHLYYNEDLSLSEIAQRFDITRQGVRDAIGRAENTLMDIEEKTGLVASFHNTRAQLQKLSETSQELSSYAQRSSDTNLIQLAKQLEGNIADLLKVDDTEEVM